MQSTISVTQLDRALTARYACADFDAIVLPQHRIEAIVGERVHFDLAVSGGNARCKLLRAPEHAGNPTTLVEGRLTPQAPGLYVVQVAMGGTGFCREVDVVAYPKAVLTKVGYGANPHAARMRLRAITNDANVTRATIVEALETKRAPERHPVFGESFPTAALSVLVGRGETGSINLKQYHA
jgi:hypothetical protein